MELLRVPFEGQIVQITPSLFWRAHALRGHLSVTITESKALSEPWLRLIAKAEVDVGVELATAWAVKQANRIDPVTCSEARIGHVKPLGKIVLADSVLRKVVQASWINLLGLKKVQLVIVK